MEDNDKTKEQLVDELRVLKREMSLMHSIFEKGLEADYELSLRNKDGSIVPVAISATVIKDAEGQPEKFVGILRDMTERKQAEKELIENLKVSRILNELMSEYIFKLGVQADGSFQMSIIAGNYSGATGRSVEDIKTTADWSKTVHPEDLNKLYITLNQVLEQRKPIEIECRSFAEDGKLRWLEITATPETDPLTNKVTAIYGSVRNITSKKLAAQNLQQSEERYRFIAERSNDLIYVYRLKPELGFEYVSPSAEKIIGYTPEDHYNDPLLGIKLVHPDDRHLLQNLQDGVVKMDTFLMRWIKKDGQMIWTESQNIPIYDEKGDLVAIQGRATDVTERKRSEQLLNARLRIIEFAQLHSRNEIQQKLLDELELLTESQIGFFHAVNTDQVSLTLQSWSTNTIENMCKADGHGKHYDIGRAGVWTDCVKQRKPVVHNDYNSLSHRKGMPEGHALVVRELVVPVFRNDTIVAIVGVGNKPTDYNENDIDTVSLLADMAWDITERKGAEESTKKLSQIVEQSPVSILITNLDGTIEYANPKACETTGYTPDELVGINPRLLKSGETSDLDYNSLWQTITAGKHWNGIFHNRKKNGEFYWESATISPIVDGNGKITHYLSIKEDITDRKQAEDDLKQREEDLNYSQEIAKMGNWELDLVNNKVKWSKNYYHLMGLEPSGGDAPSNYFKNHVHPDDIDLLDEKVREIHQTKEAMSADMRIVMPDGQIKWIQNNIVPVFEGDKLVILKGVNIDITDKKLAAEKIRQQNDRLHAIISAMPDLIFVIDRDGTYTEFYSSDTDSLIVPPNQIIGTNLRSSFDESSARFHLENINKCIDEKRLITYEYSIPNTNSIGYFEARLAPIGSDRVLTSVRDITIRKEAEFEIRDLNQNLELRIEKRTAQLAETNENLLIEIDQRIKVSTALKEALERLRKIADRIPGVVYQFRLRTDGTYCFPYVSEGIRNILKVNPEAAIEDASVIFKKIHPDDLAPLIDSIFASAKALSFWQYEYRILLDDGTERWLGGNSMPQPEEDGSVLWHGYISDITERKQTEQNLKWNQSLLNLMANSSPLGLLVVDNRTDDILYFNERFAQIWGIEQLSVQILQGELKNNEIIPYCLPVLADIPSFAESCKPLQHENNRIVLEDEIAFTGNRTVRRFTTQIRGTNDEYYGRFYIFEEITERKRIEEALRESEKRFSLFMDYLPAIVFLKDQQGRTLFVNKYMDTAFGASSWIGKTMLEVFPNELGEKLMADDLNCMYLGYLKIEERLIQLDGKSHDYETQKFTIERQGHEPWLGGISLDITDRKKAIAEIVEARNEAEKANQAKSEFLSRMSHELRTPMNSILGFAQLLQMGDLNPRQKAGVGHILNSGKHLLNLINEVLDIARIESGKVPILHEPIQVQDIVVEMMDLVHPAVLKQQQTIEFIDSPINQLFVIADRQRLRQVLLNLTNNAIKYNCPNGKVTIKTAMGTNGPEEAPVIKISITDMGLGISADDLPKLFKPFERIGAEMTETEGTGLGLAVVKKLMDAMGGTVGVKSNLGTGSTFWIELPQSIAQCESVERKSNTLAESSKVDEKTGTILYIEDNPSNVELVSQILLAQRPDILLISNKNGRMAVPLALEYSPDLILLDLDLPDIHGLEVLGLLKRKESVNQIPVVIISADAMPKQLEKLMKAGAENYLTKPLDIPIFLSVVDECIGKEG